MYVRHVLRVNTLAVEPEGPLAHDEQDSCWRANGSSSRTEPTGRLLGCYGCPIPGRLPKKPPHDLHPLLSPTPSNETESKGKRERREGDGK